MKIYQRILRDGGSPRI